jgi:hypothetical protein
LGGNISGTCLSGFFGGSGTQALTLGNFPNAVSIGTFPVDGVLFAFCNGNCESGDIALASLTISAVPEPSSLLLLGSGALALLGVFRRKLRA